MDIRNTIGWRQWISRLQGSPIDLDLRSYDDPLAEIKGLEAELTALSDGELNGRARDVRERARAGRSLDSLRAAVFALAREAARRTLGLRPFDVQVMAASRSIADGSWRCRQAREKHLPRPCPPL